ncbi:MAG: hypothetical protein IPL06_05385 [Betaproteobacteria bacterium]|nr:hypothetical protein [Betaproteobacteria bacterium]
MSTGARGASFWVAFWGGAAAVLAVAIGLEHYLGNEEPSGGPRPPAKVADARMLPPFTLAAADQFASETAARPLFTPTRRPAPPAATVQATMRKGQFVLTGITVSAEASFAFLKEVSSGKTRSVRKGAEVNGLRVDAVEPRRVVLRQGEETEDLMLAIQVPPRTAAPAPAPGAPAAGSAAPNIYAPGGVPLPGAPGGPPQAGMPAAGAPGAAPPTNPAAMPAPGVESTASRRRPWMKP